MFMLFIAAFLFSSCGVITDQHCADCKQEALFFESCRDYLIDVRNIDIPCYKDLELNPDHFCTDDDFLNGYCEFPGYNFSDEEASLLGENIDSCVSYSDYHESCENMLNTTKKALNTLEQLEHYQTGSCRYWFWEDKNDLREAIEALDCEAYVTLLFGENF